MFLWHTHTSLLKKKKWRNACSHKRQEKEHQRQSLKGFIVCHALCVCVWECNARFFTLLLCVAMFTWRFVSRFSDFFFSSFSASTYRYMWDDIYDIFLISVVILLTHSSGGFLQQKKILLFQEARHFFPWSKLFDKREEKLLIFT